MGVARCVLFSKHFSSRRVCRTYLQPVDNLPFPVDNFGETNQHFCLMFVQGLYAPPFRLGTLTDTPTAHTLLSPAHHFGRTGLYASDMPAPSRPRKESHNLQIAEVIDAIAQSDPDLFDNENATLMPVEYRDKLDIAICDAHLNNLTPYDAPAPALKTATTAIVGRMHRIARWHGALQANFERELFGAPLALSLA